LDGIAAHTLADDFVIDTPVSTTNGGNTIDGDDSLTVATSGSIDLPFGDDGVNAGGVGNTITNLGSIETIAITGDAASGIIAGDYNTITNSGSISTRTTPPFGLASGGIVVGDNNTITNSGSVTTRSSVNTGILVSSYNIVNNTGIILTSGVSSDGTRATGGGNTITNSGSPTSPASMQRRTTFSNTVRRTSLARNRPWRLTEKVE